jgi:hypothetical protein
VVLIIALLDGLIVGAIYLIAQPGTQSPGAGDTEPVIANS